MLLAMDSTDIFRAVDRRDLDGVKELLQQSPELANAWRMEQPATPLHACGERPEIATALIEAGAEVDGIDSDDRRLTPLHVFAERGDLPLVKLLLAKGASAGASSYMGTPLHTTIAGLDGCPPDSWREIAEALLEGGGDINATIDADSDCWTSLHQACNDGHLEIVEFLVERGAKINLQKDGLSALLIAQGNEFKEIVDYLRQHGAR